MKLRKFTALLLAALFLLPLAGCDGGESPVTTSSDPAVAATAATTTAATTTAATTPEISPIPDDFEFSITFNVYGISSYDSATGKLIKTTDATNPEEYVTTLTLDDDQLEEIYRLLYDLDLSSYPSDFSPTDLLSNPSEKWELTVRMAGKQHRVTCDLIPVVPFSGHDEKAQAFIDAFVQIRTILTESEEWKALPDYENLYE